MEAQDGTEDFIPLTISSFLRIKSTKIRISGTTGLQNDQQLDSGTDGVRRPVELHYCPEIVQICNLKQDGHTPVGNSETKYLRWLVENRKWSGGSVNSTTAKIFSEKQSELMAHRDHGFLNSHGNREPSAAVQGK